MTEYLKRSKQDYFRRQGYQQGIADERPKAFANGYESGYQQGREDAIEYILSGQYAQDNKKCTICTDCPKNCPIEIKEQNDE